MRIRTRLKRAAKTRLRRKVTLPVKRAARKKIRSHPLFHCGSCGKQYNNMFGHVCKGTGFRKARRQAERAAAAAAAKQKRAEERDRVNARVRAARQAERDRARARVRKARAAERARADARAAKARTSGRPPARAAPRHDYRNCRDHDCRRLPCEAWREAYAEGFAEGAASMAGG